MPKLAKLIFISTLLFFKLENSFAQSDSLTVFVKIAGPSYEKFKIYYQGKLIMDIPRGGLFLNSFKIPINPSSKDKPDLDFYITRKGLFRLGSGNVGFGVPYKTGTCFRHLVLYRDPGRKNSSPITYYWTDKEPIIFK